MKLKRIQDAVDKHPFLIGFWVFLFYPFFQVLIYWKVIEE